MGSIIKSYLLPLLSFIKAYQNICGIVDIDIIHTVKTTYR